MFAVRAVGAAVVLGSLVALAGCAPATPTSSPSAPPVSGPAQQYYCTPDGATSGAPCSQEEWEAQVARDKQYEEAEAIYRRLNAAERELYVAGAEADDTVLQFVVGEAREVVVDAHAQRPRLVEGDFEIVWVRRTPEVAQEGDALVLTACVDNTNAMIAVPGEGTGPGATALERVSFVRDGGVLKIGRFAAKEVVSC